MTFGSDRNATQVKATWQIGIFVDKRLLFRSLPLSKVKSNLVLKIFQLFSWMHKLEFYIFENFPSAPCSILWDLSKQLPQPLKQLEISPSTQLSTWRVSTLWSVEDASHTFTATLLRFRSIDFQRVMYQKILRLKSCGCVSSQWVQEPETKWKTFLPS